MDFKSKLATLARPKPSELRVPAVPDAAAPEAQGKASTLRELREMRYLWQVPLSMDNAKLLAVLGHEPHTPLDQAVQVTLEGLGCLAVPCR